jgi:hypothetical protein
MTTSDISHCSPQGWFLQVNTLILQLDSIVYQAGRMKGPAVNAVIAAVGAAAGATVGAAVIAAVSMGEALSPDAYVARALRSRPFR